MKRLLITALLTAALGACSKEIVFNRNDISPTLLVNSQMTAGDSFHIVYLAISKDVRIDTINSGSVRCYINGELAAEGIVDDSDDDAFTTDEETGVYGIQPGGAKQTRFIFKADFKPGDLVRIEAEANDGAYKAYSEVTVPKAPEFHIADTSYQKNTPDGSMFFNGSYRIILSGNDIRGETDYYRLKMGYSRVDRAFRDDADGPKRWDVRHEFRHVRFDKGNDPILNDIATSENLDLFGASQNSFNVFSDRLFTDETFRITTEIDSSIPDSFPMVDKEYDRTDSEISLSAVIYGITEDEYHYLKAVSIYDYVDGDTLFTEPVSFPDNVEGGVGLVSICTPAVATVIFKRTFGRGGILYSD